MPGPPPPAAAIALAPGIAGNPGEETAGMVALTAVQLLAFVTQAIAECPSTEPVAPNVLWLDSGVLTLSVGIPPVITDQPDSQSIAEGLSVTLSVTATNATGYQWRRAGVAISGATSASYTFEAAIADNGISYTCVATGLGGSVTSNAAVLTVTSLPSITSATLVFDFNPAAAGFTDGQAVSSFAAANNGSIVATQSTPSSQPLYRAAAGRRLKPCLDFDGGDLLNITASSFRHLFVVADGDYPTEIPASFGTIYCAGNGGDFHQYCMIFASAGSTPQASWQNPSGTFSRKQNGELVPAGGYWNSWIRPSQINIYDISKTIDWPIAQAHTLGGMTGQPSRGFDGRIYRVVGYTTALSAEDRQSIIDYLRVKYQAPQIIFSGDSLTLGVGGTNQATAYPTIARAAVTGSYSYWVSAISGYQIETLTSLVDPTAVHPQKPHTIVQWAGANNFAVGGQTAAQAKAFLDANLAAHKAAIPGVRIIVCTLYTDNRAATGNAAQYRAQAPTFNSLIVADSNYTNGTRADGIVRLDQITQLADATNTTFFSDGLHLTDAGYALVGAAVAAKINEMDAA